MNLNLEALAHELGHMVPLFAADPALPHLEIEVHAGGLRVGVPAGTPDVVVAASVWGAVVAQSAFRLVPFGFASMPAQAQLIRSLVYNDTAAIGNAWRVNETDGHRVGEHGIEVLPDDLLEQCWCVGVGVQRNGPQVHVLTTLLGTRPGVQVGVERRWLSALSASQGMAPAMQAH